MLRENLAKKKIKNGEVVSFVSLESTHPGTAEVLALAGVDIICIDNEHGCFSSEQIVNTTRAITCLGKAAILRTTCCDPYTISHYMDCGLSGIFATMVKDAKAVQDVINGVKFAPLGKRNVCFNSRAASFGMHGMSPEEYMNFSNRNTMIMVNIECQSAIDDLDAIIALDQIDIIQTGIWDLASDYGHNGHAEVPEIQEINNKAIKKIVDMTGVASINALTLSEIPGAIENGFKILNLGSDYSFIAKYVEICQRKISDCIHSNK